MGLNHHACPAGKVREGGGDLQSLRKEVIKVPNRFTGGRQENASGKLGGRIIHIRRMPRSPLDASIDKAGYRASEVLFTGVIL